MVYLQVSCSLARVLLFCVAAHVVSQQVVGQSAKVGASQSLTTTSPFSQMAREIELPPLPTDPKVSPTPVDLGLLNAENNETIKLTVYSGFAALEAGYEFNCVPANSKGNDQWNVMLKRPDKSGAAKALTLGSGELFAKPILTLSQKNLRLQLMWNPGNVSRHNSQLANALLELSGGSHRHEVRLRKVVERDSIPLDLNKEELRIPLKIDNLPSMDSLSCIVNDVELSGYEKATAGFKFKDGMRQAALGKQLVLLRSGEIQTAVCINLIERQLGPELRIRAVYRSDDKRARAFVAHKVKIDYQRLQQTLAKGRALFSEAQAAVPHIESELRSVTARVPNDVKEATQQKNAIKTLNGQLRKAQSTVRRYDGSLPKLEASIATTGKILELGEELHNKVRFHLAVVASADDRSLELVRFGEKEIRKGSILIASP